MDSIIDLARKSTQHFRVVRLRAYKPFVDDVFFDWDCFASEPRNPPNPEPWTRAEVTKDRGLQVPTTTSTARLLVSENTANIRRNFHNL